MVVFFVLRCQLSLDVVWPSDFEVSCRGEFLAAAEILLFTSPEVIDEVPRVPVVSCCSV